MIELPEAFTIARQMNDQLGGKQIASAVRGNVPHKFAFYTRTPEEYATILAGKTVGEVSGYGSVILASIVPGYVLVLGGGGERIQFHQEEKSLPPKHHLLLRFADGTHLTVTIQGWGSVLLLERSRMHEHPHIGEGKVSPVGEEFTEPYFEGLFAGLEEGDVRSIKFFVVSKPGVWGVGNGYLQDILFRARIHPRRRALDLSAEERRALYAAIGGVLQEGLALGGRDSERDLFNRPGGYKRVLDSKSVGQPCPVCGAPIEKMQYLGGAAYFCPHCQV